MTPRRPSTLRHAARHRQRGVVLFIALIVMVVMTLAAIALFRSMDTTNQAVGNLAFRQSSILPANQAVEAAAASLFPDANNGGPQIADRTRNYDALNYVATYQGTDNSIGVPARLQTYAAARSLAVQLKDEAGNDITYLIERMCRPGTPEGTEEEPKLVQHCDLLNPKQSFGTTVNDPELIKFPKKPFYRVTVRVDGPKKTTTFLQAVLR